LLQGCAERGRCHGHAGGGNKRRLSGKRKKGKDCRVVARRHGRKMVEVSELLPGNTGTEGEQEKKNEKKKKKNARGDNTAQILRGETKAFLN